MFTIWQALYLSANGRNRLLHEVNVEGTKNVMEACIQSKIKRLVYVSSIHAFEEPPFGTPITETKDFNPSKVIGQYAKSKAAATNAVFKGVERGLDAVIVHPTGIIGPYEYRLSNTGQLIYDFLHKKLFAYIDGSYDFVDIRDVAKGIILACEKGRMGENYILSGEQVTVRGILKILEDETGIKTPNIKIPIWLAKLTSPLSELYYKIKKQQSLYTSYSIATLLSNSITTHEKAAKELGYTARSIKESIRDTAKFSFFLCFLVTNVLSHIR
ncbi:MAG TPA: NAD-dependent epimerase/dehydratase family protein, partial [Clostridia bacterium]|nr:NAD-dependent epimerase/dehydratase family protein [Clostridia bacterium]